MVLEDGPQLDTGAFTRMLEYHAVSLAKLYCSGSLQESCFLRRMKMRVNNCFFRGIAIMVIMLCVLKFYSFESDANENYEVYADKLNQLGIFNGTSEGYELDRAPTRVEAAVMFIRLLGLEDFVLQQNFSHPFEDVPTWAEQYIGFLYEAKLTNGTSETTYGSNDTISADMFMTFVLRALDYNDQTGDFSWDEALEFAYDIELITPEIYDELIEKNFLRAQLSQLSYLALQMPYKNSKITIAERLIVYDSIDVKMVVEMGIVTPENALAMIRSRQLTEESNKEKEYIVPISEEILRCLIEQDMTALKEMFSEDRQDSIVFDEVFEYFTCDEFVNAEIKDSAGGGSSWSDGERVEWNVTPEIRNIEVVIYDENGNAITQYYSIYYKFQIVSEDKSLEGIQYIILSKLDENMNRIDSIEIGH